MVMVLDYDKLRRIYRLEKSTTRLVEVEENIFQQLYSLIKEERKKYLDSLQDLNTARARDFGNLKKLVDEWFLLREKKLLNTVLLCARTQEKDEEHMSAEEKELFTVLYDSLIRHRTLTKKVLEANGEEFVPLTKNENSAGREVSETTAEENKTKEKENPVEKQDPVVKVLVSTHVPRFVGVNSKEYGPFVEGDVVELPSAIARLFVSRNLGVIEE
jgi:DNA replication initiation complex subunit (GINS family)